MPSHCKMWLKIVSLSPRNSFRPLVTRYKLYRKYLHNYYAYTVHNNYTQMYYDFLYQTDVDGTELLFYRCFRSIFPPLMSMVRHTVKQPAKRDIYTAKTVTCISYHYGMKNILFTIILAIWFSVIPMIRLTRVMQCTFRARTTNACTHMRQTAKVKGER